jgi:hypothetical protein
MWTRTRHIRLRWKMLTQVRRNDIRITTSAFVIPILLLSPVCVRAQVVHRKDAVYLRRVKPLQRCSIARFQHHPPACCGWQGKNSEVDGCFPNVQDRRCDPETTPLCTNLHRRIDRRTERDKGHVLSRRTIAVIQHGRHAVAQRIAATSIHLPASP